MPRLLRASEPPPPIPQPSNVVWWAQFNPPWLATVKDAPVDAGRTLRLADYDDRVRTKGQVPLQPANIRNTSVYAFKQFAMSRVPLPDRVQLLPNSDAQWFGVDAVGQRYWEVSALGPTLFPWWRADSVRVFDLSKPWQDTPSVCGAGIPMWAMVPHPTSLRAGAGGVRHALHFVVAGGYHPECAPGYTKSDGTDPAHPLRAGESLRITAKAFDRLWAEAETPDDRALLWACMYFGCKVNDQTSLDAGHAIRMPFGADITIGLRLTDFEVVSV